MLCRLGFPFSSGMGSLNVGVLGHVDSGKTTLTRALAELASTNAFDKHAENGARRNTIDLGFSMVRIDDRRLALVDCPGHAGLIRAVLAASNVFDMALVVVDASCGIQPQTAEHLLLCSIFCPDKVIVVLNKIDLLTSKEQNVHNMFGNLMHSREMMRSTFAYHHVRGYGRWTLGSQISTIIIRLRKSLKAVGVDENSPIVPISLLNATEDTIVPLLDVIRQRLFEPKRCGTGKLLFAVDHCFAIKGKGTVITGTVLDGMIEIGKDVEFPILKVVRKVKGLESWKEAVKLVGQGERAAVLVNDLNAGSISRTLEMQHVVCSVEAIQFYKGNVLSNVHCHLSIAFETVMATAQFLQEEENGEFEQLKEMKTNCIALLTLDRSVYCRIDDVYLISKLDHQGKGCRFLFHGRVLRGMDDVTSIPRFVRKSKSGQIERVENARSVICSSLFKKETKMSLFEGMTVRLSTGELGRIDGSFGKGGKCRLTFVNALADETVEKVRKGEMVRVSLFMKKFLNNKNLRSYIPSQKELEEESLS